MKRPSHHRATRSALLLCVASTCLPGCNTPTDTPPAGNKIDTPRVTGAHITTRLLDAYQARLLELATPQNQDDDTQRLNLYKQRWQTVMRAVTHHGTTHREAFYGSRAYWHTGSQRGLDWAVDSPSDLAEPLFVDSKGNVRITGDVNADIEIRGDAVVHILGDLSATLELKGVCEVVVAGNLTNDALIICDGQLELFVGGASAGILGSTQSSTIIIDGNASGTLQAGAPATTLTVTGDLSAQIPAPKDKDAVLTMRIDGYTPTRTMLDLATAGFTRVNATLGKSNAPAGLYPADPNAGARPVARWVVLEQRVGRGN